MQARPAGLRADGLRAAQWPADGNRVSRVSRLIGLHHRHARESPSSLVPWAAAAILLFAARRRAWRALAPLPKLIARVVVGGRSYTRDRLGSSTG